MTTPTLDSFFSAGGGKSVSWKDKPIGTTVSGIIKAVHPPTQVTDYISKEPKFKKDGSPVMQVRIDLATTEREDGEDDGMRSLYSSGWMTGAIGDAIRKAGVEGAPQVGGTLTVRLAERAAADTPGLTYNKYDAHYVPPSPAAAFFGGGAPQQGGALPPLGAQAPAAPQQPVPQPNIAGTGYAQPPAQAPLGASAPAAAPPAAGPLSPEQIAAIMASGAAPAAAPPAEPEPARPEQMNEAAWNQLDLASKKQVAATFSQLPPF